jgi:hypothetical protein
MERDLDIVNKRKEKKVFFFRSVWTLLLAMGCLFSYFLRPSASADILDTPRQLFSW